MNILHLVFNLRQSTPPYLIMFYLRFLNNFASFSQTCASVSYW